MQSCAVSQLVARLHACKPSITAARAVVRLLLWATCVAVVPMVCCVVARGVQFIVYQMLKALKYCHSGGLVHRDLKPSNLLLNEECLLKVADFGLARSLRALKGGDQEGASVLTDYVATRWYRAPEIILGSNNYTFAVDMWAVGCIIAEMFIGKPMVPGSRCAAL